MQRRDTHGHIAIFDLPEAAIAPDSLQQVIMNIVTNGLDAMARSERKVVRVLASAEDGRIAREIVESVPFCSLK